MCSWEKVRGVWSGVMGMEGLAGLTLPHLTIVWRMVRDRVQRTGENVSTRHACCCALGAAWKHAYSIGCNTRAARRPGSFAHRYDQRMPPISYGPRGACLLTRLGDHHPATRCPALQDSLRRSSIIARYLDKLSTGPSVVTLLTLAVENSAEHASPPFSPSPGLASCRSSKTITTSRQRPHMMIYPLLEKKCISLL